MLDLHVRLHYIQLPMPGNELLEYLHRDHKHYDFALQF